MEIACRRGKYKIVELLLKLGSTSRPIWEAVAGESVKVVQLLLDAGVNPNEKEKHTGMTLLHKAAQNGNSRIGQLLLDRGADIHARTTKIHNWLQPVHCTAMEGSPFFAKLLVERGANLEARTATGGTPLFIAALHGNHFPAEVFLKKGVDVEAKDNEGITPLFAAVDSQSERVVRMLLQKGADPCFKFNGHSLISVACATNLPVLKALLKYGCQENLSCNLFAKSAERGDIKMIEWLIKRGADPNSSVEFLNALECACQSSPENVDLVNFLLENGAPVNIDRGFDQHLEFSDSDEEGYKYLEKDLHPEYTETSALSTAIKKGHLKIARILLERRAVGSHRVVLLACGSENDNDEAVRLLYEFGFGGKNGAKGKRKALCKAVRCLNFKIVRFLLQHDGFNIPDPASTIRARNWLFGGGKMHKRPLDLNRLLVMTPGSGRKKSEIGKLLIHFGCPVDSKNSIHKIGRKVFE